MNEEMEVLNSRLGDADFRVLKKQIESLDQFQLESLKETIEANLNVKRGDLLSDLEREAILALFQ